MYLQTNTEISYNYGVGSSATSVVRGFIDSFSWLNDWTKLAVNYRYEKEDGTIIKRSGFEIETAEIDALNGAVEPLLTATEYRAKERERAHLGFIVQMAQTFSLDQSQISIVVDLEEEPAE